MHAHMCLCMHIYANESCFVCVCMCVCVYVFACACMRMCTPLLFWRMFSDDRRITPVTLQQLHCNSPPLQQLHCINPWSTRPSSDFSCSFFPITWRKITKTAPYILYSFSGVGEDGGRGSVINNYLILQIPSVNSAVSMLTWLR